MNYGIFLELEEGIEGLVHISEISWTKYIKHPSDIYKVGDKVDAVILSVDYDDKKISLGIKQLTADNFHQYAKTNSKGSIVKGVIHEVDSRGAVVELAEGITGYLKVSEISKDRVEDASTVLKQGAEVEVVITLIDKRTRNISLSMKAKDSVEEKAAMKDYNDQSTQSSSSTLGDLLKEAKDK